MDYFNKGVVLNNIDKLKSLLGLVFKVDANKINNDTSPDNLPEWDSLKHLNMVLALEEAYKISISEEAAMEMLSFELVVLTLRECGVEI